ncbi:hypothetical protein BJX63DRAFT_42789 [Aspergillus granulosus]|uniref:C2H2-type domain-containing protein n=1 Tax=Aspergillus granulosus TaxID=176169 RepID=A0ABR4GYF5_9EURO
MTSVDTMEDTQHPEPIFELASECESIYAKQITAFNDAGDENAAKIISDMYQRFVSWAAFLGVFAESNVCLDQRLHRYVDIQEQVILLLDIMRRNLTCLCEDQDSPRPNKTTVLEESDPLSQPVLVSMQSLEAISETIDRLNQLGTAIRRSSVTSQASKARELAETFDLGSFEQVAYMSLRTLYPDTSNPLIEQLTRSMVESYALFLHRRSRKRRLEVTRPRHRPRSPPLHPIREELSDDYDASDPNPTDPEPLHKGEKLQSGISQTAPVHPVPQSEPTSVDSQEFKARMKRLLNPSVKSKPVSILANLGGYPRPGKNALSCDWCFEPLSPDSLEGLKWQQHINGDFKPYVCISEKCSQAPPRFASSTEWFHHMIGDHGKNWHREVHAPSSWICPLCIEKEAEFSDPESLSEHLNICHEDIFNDQQIKAIVRQSRFASPGPEYSCPLCCFPISDDQHPLAFQERRNIEGSSKGNQYIPRPDDSGPKRIRIDTSHLQSSDSSIHPASIAIHMAAHLQSIMAFSMRLMSIGPIKDTTGSQSAATDTDDQSSWIGSGPKDPDQGISTYLQKDSLEHDDDIMDFEYGPLLTETVPDSEYVDWGFVPRGHEDILISHDDVFISHGDVLQAESTPIIPDIPFVGGSKDILPKDRQLRTPTYDYAYEKSMSHAEAKRFYQQQSNVTASNIDQGADANIPDEDGGKQLLRASEIGLEGVVKLLLETGKVDPDSKDSNSRTPLSLAAENGHEAAVVKLLLETGKVDPDSKDSNGRTPLSWAAEKGHEAVLSSCFLRLERWIQTPRIQMVGHPCHGL